MAEWSIQWTSVLILSECGFVPSHDTCSLVQFYSIHICFQTEKTKRIKQKIHEEVNGIINRM